VRDAIWPSFQIAGQAIRKRLIRFSNRPVGVKRCQTIHHFSVDVARGLVLLSGIGTKALPSWDSKTRRANGAAIFMTEIKTSRLCVGFRKFALALFKPEPREPGTEYRYSPSVHVIIRNAATSSRIASCARRACFFCNRGQRCTS
jgi:hypothetical protein